MGVEMKAKVVKKFYDLTEKIDRYPDEEFDCTPERFAEIYENLPGYIEKCAAQRRKATAKPKE